MFKVIFPSAQRTFQRKCLYQNKPFFAFATYDPYYILGVDRRAEFAEVKKAYFKLIAQYHPDKNPSPDAVKKFVLIKDAFEDVKRQLGQEVKMTYDNQRGSASSNFSSVRPDPKRYKEDFENSKEEDQEGNNSQQKYGQFDFREHAARAPEGEEYDKFRDSFENIADINESKFTPIDADIPDASKRFNLEDKIAKNNILPEDSKVVFLILTTAFVVFVVYMSGANTKSLKAKYDVAIYHMLNKEKLEALREEYDSSEEITKNLKKNEEYKEYVRRMDANLSKNTVTARVPVIREFVPLRQAAQSISNRDE